MVLNFAKAKLITDCWKHAAEDRPSFADIYPRTRQILFATQSLRAKAHKHPRHEAMRKAHQNSQGSTQSSMSIEMSPSVTSHEGLAAACDDSDDMEDSESSLATNENESNVSEDVFTSASQVEQEASNAAHHDNTVEETFVPAPEVFSSETVGTRWYVCSWLGKPCMNEN